MLKIITYPNTILESKNDEVIFPLSSQTKKLIDQMWDTVKEQGIGLAAPQVGANLKICIIHLGNKNKSKFSKRKDQDFVMINPEIEYYSEARSLFTEGCLSFPDQYYEIWRPQGITVKYFNEKGSKITKTFSGLVARVIQHEIDHLNGKLFINMGGKKLESNEIDTTKIVD